MQELDRSRYMNYAGIGMVIGHEITHGFDNRGRQYDKNGNRVQWWDRQSIEKFQRQASCFVQQYSQYGIDSISQSVSH